MAKHWHLIVVTVIGCLLGLSIAFLADKYNHSATRNIEWLNNPRAIKDFTLKSENGDFDKEKLLGKWTVLVFGYLHCPDICPTSLALMSRLIKRFNNQTQSDAVQFVFVSVDPKRDSVSQVSDYCRFFNPAILGVTGSDSELQGFASNLGVRYRISEQDQEYAVAHSITFSIISPDGKLSGRFRPIVTESELVDSFVAQIHHF